MQSISWWSMPGPQRFIQEVLEALYDGRSTIVVFPAYHPHGFVDAAKARDRDRGERRWDYVERCFNELDSERESPLTLLYNCSYISDDAIFPRTLQSLLSNQEFRDKVFFFEFHYAPAWETWCRFIYQYSQASKAMPSNGRPVFCAIIKGLTTKVPPQTDVNLSITYWRGIATHLDMELYVSELMGPPKSHPLIHWVRLSVIAALAGSDPRLAERLVPVTLDVLFDPSDRLKAYASEVGWEGLGDNVTDWTHGACDEVDGRKHLHAAAVALRGDRKEIERRVWQGQVKEILPYVEAMRHRLIDSARAHLPQPPISDEYGTINDLYDLEIRNIWYYLRCAGARGPRGLLEQAGCLRDIRNAIAHLEPISVANLERLTRFAF